MMSRLLMLQQVYTCIRPMVWLMLTVPYAGPLEASPKEKHKENDHICFFVASSGIIDNFGARERQIFLLTEQSNFTETKLRNLARYFFERYPDPKNLHISLYSDIDQLRDLILHRIEQTEPNEAFEKYPHGIILRTNGNEIIRYTTPPERGWKTIVLKGRD